MYGALFHINRFWPSNINLNKMGLAKAKVTNNEKDVDLELIYSSDFVIDVLFGLYVTNSVFSCYFILKILDSMNIFNFNKGVYFGFK
jgi:hypothetical protein